MLFNHVKYSKSTCVHVPDGGIGSPVSPRSSRERKELLHSGYQAHRLSQEFHGKDEFSRLIRHWPRDSGLLVRLFGMK